MTNKRPPDSFRHTCAVMFRSLANRLDAGRMPDPTVSELAQGQLLRAEMALLDALAERERWVHTVNLLHARIGRLRATPSHDHPDPALAHAARLPAPARHPLDAVVGGRNAK